MSKGCCQFRCCSWGAILIVIKAAGGIGADLPTVTKNSIIGAIKGVHEIGRSCPEKYVKKRIEEGRLSPFLEVPL